ncbi:MAG: flavin reductase family protein [Thermodesulfobacteriota bacterium]
MLQEKSPPLSPEVAAALSHLHYGLYFLTTGRLAQPQGLLVSWVSQVSGNPPWLLAAVRHNRSILPALQGQGAFALNLLPADKPELVAALGRPAAQRFAGLALEEGPLGLPLLAAGLGALCCRVRETWRPGDHLLLAGPVEAARWRGGGAAFSVAQTGHAYLGLS